MKARMVGLALATLVVVAAGDAAADFVDVGVTLAPAGSNKGCAAEVDKGYVAVSQVKGDVVYWMFASSCGEQKVEICQPPGRPLKDCRGDASGNAVTGTAFTIMGGDAAMPAKARLTCTIDWALLPSTTDPSMPACVPGNCPKFKITVINNRGEERESCPNPCADSAKKAPPDETDDDDDRTAGEQPPLRPCPRGYELTLEVVP